MCFDPKTGAKTMMEPCGKLPPGERGSSAQQDPFMQEKCFSPKPFFAYEGASKLAVTHFPIFL